MDIKNLTPEQKKELAKQLAEEKKLQKQKQTENREALKKLQAEFVDKFFPKLVGIAKQLTLSKAEVFDNTKSILALKKEVYGLTDEMMEKQQSHNISTENTDKTIIIGYNVKDGWDKDLAAAGIEKINQWLVSQMKFNNKNLVDMIRDLLKPNKDGILKASRIIDLANRANKMGDQELINAVAEVQAAYRPEKTTTYVKAKYRNEDGQDVWLNLSMSNA